MKFEKLNSLAAVHRYRPTEFTFSDVYAEASQLLLKTHIHMILKIRGVTLHDAQETFHDALLAAFDRRKEEGFGEALSALLKLKRMERHRSTVRRNERFKLTLDASIEHEDGTFTPMNEPVDEVLTEDEALKTKDAQKRQLLDILADRANDPVAKKIATHMVELTGSKQFLTDTGSRQRAKHVPQNCRQKALFISSTVQTGKGRRYPRLLPDRNPSKKGIHFRVTRLSTVGVSGKKPDLCSKRVYHTFLTIKQCRFNMYVVNLW